MAKGKALIRPLSMALLLSGLLLSGCETTPQVPAVDQVLFKPEPAENRVLASPQIKWLSRQDAQDYCARILGVSGKPGIRVMACAFWNVRRKECTMVTPAQTQFNYIGHEMRHCFEGTFHP